MWSIKWLLTLLLVVAIAVIGVIAKDTSNDVYGPGKSSSKGLVKLVSAKKSKSSSSKNPHKEPVLKRKEKKMDDNNNKDVFIIMKDKNTSSLHTKLSAGQEEGDYTFYADTEGVLYSKNDKLALNSVTRITSPVGTNLHMICPHFDLNFKGCNKERLIISEPNVGIAKTKACKRDAPGNPVYITASNTIVLKHLRNTLTGAQCTGGFMCSFAVGKTPSVTGECKKYILGANQYTIIFSQNDGGQRKCSYRIQAPKGSSLQVRCDVFGTRKGCRNEHILLRSKGVPKQKYCLNNKRPIGTIEWNSNKLIIRHIRKPLNKKCSGGFLCFVSAIDSSPNPGPGPNPNPGQRPFCDNCWQNSVTVPRIVGGVEVSIEDYPFFVLLNLGGDYKCGGTLIKPSLILTAAHCIRESGATSVIAYLGIDDVNSISTAQTLFSNEIVIHPDYEEATVQNDLALVKLSTNAQLNDRVKTICIGGDNDIQSGNTAVILGFGVLQSGTTTTSSKLRGVAVETITEDSCKNLVNAEYPININNFCSLTEGKDACQGDSGGPVIGQSSDGVGVLLGVVSFGNGCGDGNNPGVHARIANVDKIKWIREVSGDSC